MICIIMGVSGSGKTTIGKLLAARLQMPFFDADHFHSKENIDKMKNGKPLTDIDREPWLTELSLLLKKSEMSGGCVLACSALREKYRLKLQEGVDGKINWIHLYGTPALISNRIKNRSEHFMTQELLRSQFDILEIPTGAYSISIEHTPELIIQYIIENLKTNI